MQLERLVIQLQGHVERLISEKDQLEERLQLAQKDRRFVEKIFDEIEEEHEKALCRIDLLENEVHVLSFPPINPFHYLLRLINISWFLFLVSEYIFYFQVQFPVPSHIRELEFVPFWWGVYIYLSWELRYRC